MGWESRREKWEFVFHYKWLIDNQHSSLSLVIAHDGGDSLWQSKRDQYLKISRAPYRWSRPVPANDKFGLGLIASGLVDESIDIWNPLDLI